ncbi:hypothetical protein AKH00_01240 [Microbacterium sp. GCS4]|nr:hypothetical protein AKH00_01240 [Microbacterium sp. GCS4]
MQCEGLLRGLSKRLTSIPHSRNFAGGIDYRRIVAISTPEIDASHLEFVVVGLGAVALVDEVLELPDDATP